MSDRDGSDRGDQRPGGLPSLTDLHQRVAAAEEEDLLEEAANERHRALAEQYARDLFGDDDDFHHEEPDPPHEDLSPVPLGRAVQVVEHLLDASVVEPRDEE